MKKGIVLEIKNNRAVIITPEGEFLSIPSNLSWNIGEEVLFEQKENKNNGNKTLMQKVYQKKGLWIALAACIMLLLMPFTNITEASTYITIDINPSIELELKGTKVINIKALNSDGEKIIAKIPNTDKDLYSITDNIINQAKELGYLTSDEENYIMIGLCKEDSDFRIAEYEQFIEEELFAYQLEAKILVVNGTKDEKKLADNKNVSLGKYVLQQSKKLEGIEITDEQLTKDNVKDIIKSNKDNNDINDNKDNGPNNDQNSNQYNNGNNPNSENKNSNNSQPNNENPNNSNSNNQKNSDSPNPNKPDNNSNNGNSDNKDKNGNTTPSNDNSDTNSSQGTNNANNKKGNYINNNGNLPNSASDNISN